MRLFGRSVLGGETAPGLSILILPTIAEAWRTASTLHVAANAANGDNSPCGDLIYTARETTKTRPFRSR
ncbi:MAG: hypothetical protein IH878_19105 [Gemmatimonadetes bacterium]|nr:hypothetical protein [Gemmatimonadota bacterium]